MKKVKKQEKRDFGIVTFCYPFKGFILVNGLREKLGEFKELLKDEEVCLRTEKFFEKLSSIENNLVYPGAMGFHCAGDFVVEEVTVLTAKEIEKYNVPATWGEYWSIGS